MVFKINQRAFLLAVLISIFLVNVVILTTNITQLFYIFVFIGSFIICCLVINPFVASKLRKEQKINFLEFFIVFASGGIIWTILRLLFKTNLVINIFIPLLAYIVPYLIIQILKKKKVNG